MKLNVFDYYMLRLNLSCSNSGEFLDNQDERLVFVVMDCADEDGTEFKVLFQTKIGLKILEDASMEELVLHSIKDSDFANADLLRGLLISSYERDPDGLFGINPAYEEAFFEANETDDTSPYITCAFAIGSSSCNLEGIFVDSETGQSDNNGEELSDPSMLYGTFDEDDTWVVGVIDKNI